MISSIQVLRGIAALLVVLSHVQPQLDHFGGPHLAWLGAGGGGVDIFFVISGFIIWVTSQPVGMNPGKFIKRRFIRIVPLYWLITAFVTSVALIMPSVMSSTRFDAAHVLASFLFIPYPHPILQDIYPIVVPGWSLNYEAFFYALFAAMLFVRNRLAVAIGMIAVLSALVICGKVFAPSQIQAAYFTQPIVLEFAFGIAIGTTFTHARPLPVWGGAGVLVAGVAAFVASSIISSIDNQNRVFLVGVPAAAIIWGISILHRHRIDPANAALSLLGDASYSIYLSHVIVLPIGARLWTKLGIGYDAGWLVAFICFELVFAAIVGWLLYVLIERRMLRYLRGQFERYPKPVASAF